MRTEYNNYASQALEKAAQDAASCHQKYIGTEHLILGLLAPVSYTHLTLPTKRIV